MRVSLFSPTDHIPDAVLEFARRRVAELVGLVLVVLMVAYALALASWSVADPSINHAVDGPVRNLLGRPGAMVADIAMQMLGLAAIAMLAPPLLWGWGLLRYRRIPRLRRRLILWLAGTLAAAGFAAILPITDRWPLPTGLGGVTGDALMAFPRWLAMGARPVIIACGLACALAAILALSAATRGGEEPDPTAELEEAADRLAERREAKARRKAARESEDADGEPGLALISLGAVIHGGLALKAQLGRLLRAHPTAREAAPERAPWLDPRFNPDLENPAIAAAMRPARREAAQARPDATYPPLEPQDGPDAAHGQSGLGQPRFDPADYAPPSRRAQAMGESQAQEPPRPAAPRAPAPEEAPWDDEPIPSARVSEPAPAPKPGRRITREKQPSLLDRAAYEMPPLGMLSEPKKIAGTKISNDALEQNARLLEGVLDDFGVKGEIINVRPGPVVTLYELEPAPGIKSSRVIGLADDIARSMSAISARVAVVQGRNAIGIELPNQKRETVFLRELLASQDFEKTKHKLSIALGKTIGGEPVLVDLAKMPHLLVAGTTGSGKSVAINTMILSLLYRLKPEECRLIMVDPKMLELSVYDGIPHLLTPVVTDPKKAVVALKWAVREMEDRYKKMSKLGVRNIDGFNSRVGEAQKNGEVITRTVQTGYDRETGEAIYEQEQMELSVLPYIVVIVDEMADLMMVAGKDIEGAIQRLAQMARAAGIHLIMATQRPSVDVITGTIKANFPTRISFQVTSKIDSRTILGEQGAEQLLGQGDMLYMAGGGRISRVHGPFVADNEVEKVVAHLKMQGQPDYLDAITEEDAPEADSDGPAGPAGSMDAEESGDLYDRAVNIVLKDRKVSTSYIQRRLSVGYNKAASLVERMEKEGVVSPANHSGKREILVGGGVDRGAYELQDED